MAILTAKAGTFGHSSSNRLQLSLICEQDPIHATFCAVVIDDIQTEKDLTRLAETVRGLETGNPAKPALLLSTVSASGNQTQALQKYLAEHVPTASVIFVMEDAACVDMFGIAPDHVAKLPTIDIESPKQPPPKVAQTNQHLAEPPVSAASQTITPEPIAQHATSKPRQAVAPQPSRPQSVGPPSLTRDELEALILLSRSLEVDLAFSRQSLAFAMGQAPDATERLLRRWLQHGVVMPAGHAHDIEAFAVPDAIRRDIADLVAQQPELSRPPLIDFGQMSARLSALSPLAPPYHGTKLAAQFDVASTASISAWSADIVSKAYTLGSLEATRQILRAHQKLLVVDLLPTVVALEHRTVYWRRVFIIAVTALILAGILIGLFVALTRATDWGLFLAAIIAFGLLATLVIWAINHQIARAWLRLWGEMGLK